MASASGAEAARAGLPGCAADWAVARRVEAGGWRVRYRAAGEGPPLVLVHGLGVSADYWWRNGPPLAAAGHQVLAPDLPGFGRTEGPPEGLSVPAQVEALLRWADALELGPAVYVGHSLSCQTALELAAAEPARVRGLVLAAPTGAPGRHRILRQFAGLLRDIPRESPRLAVEVAKAYLQAGPARVWRTWQLGGREDPLPLLPRVAAAGMVVVGDRDPVVPREFAETLADGLREGELRWVEGAAHAVIFTHAAAFNAAVLDLAARVA